MNIYEALREDHDTQRDLLAQLLQTSGDTEERRSLYERVKAELTDHAAAEERHFYIPLMKVDLTQEKSRHGIAEHHEIDELIATLDETDMSSPAWLTHARSLDEKVRHHLDEEEHEIFQLSGRVLSESQKQSLADAYLAEMKP